MLRSEIRSCDTCANVQRHQNNREAKEITFIYDKKPADGGGYVYSLGYIHPVTGNYIKLTNNVGDEAQVQAQVSHLNGGPSPQALERIADSLEAIEQHLAPKPSVAEKVRQLADQIKADREGVD